MPLTARTDEPAVASDRRRVPADVRRTLHDAAIAHVADAADAVSSTARQAREDPGPFAEAREELERRLMRLRLVETDMPLPGADLEALAGFAVDAVRTDLQALLDEPAPRFDRIAELAAAADDVVELVEQRGGRRRAAPGAAGPRVARRGGGLP